MIYSTLSAFIAEEGADICHGSGCEIEAEYLSSGVLERPVSEHTIDLRQTVQSIYRTVPYFWMKVNLILIGSEAHRTPSLIM